MPLIDDLEDCDVNLGGGDGRSGMWFRYADTKSMLRPDSIATEKSGAPQSPKCSVRATGTIANGGYGGVGFKFGTTFNASGYKGVSLWAKGNGTVRLAVITPGTQDKSLGGICEKDCYGHYGMPIQVGGQWKKYEIRWTDPNFKQPFGTPVTFESALVIGMQFEISQGSFDVSVDDVQFMN
jgi:hypothetical protein